MVYLAYVSHAKNALLIVIMDVFHSQNDKLANGSKLELIWSVDSGFMAI